MKAIKMATMLLALGAVAATQANVININFTSGNWSGDIDGTKVDGLANVGPATSGDNWNDLTGSGAITKDDAGVLLTGVNLTVVENGNYDYAATLNVLKGYMYANANNPLGWTITGLANDSKWDVYVIAHGDSVGQGSEWTIGTASASTAAAIQNPGTWDEGESYVKFASVIATSGNITAAATPKGGYYALNGIQLVAVPEPAVLSLVMAVSGGMLFIRRRLLI